MRVAYVEIREGGLAEKLPPQPRADVEADWEWAVEEQLEFYGHTLRRLHLMREGDILRRAEFDGLRGPTEVLLIDDGSW